MPHEAARGMFYPGLMLILAGIYLVRGITWWTTPTPGRAAGIDWVSEWMSTGVIAGLWFVTAAAAVLAAVLALKSRRRTLLIVLSLVTIVLPVTVSLYFFASTVIFWFDPTPLDPPDPTHWRDQGSETGWVTGIEYAGWALVSFWGLLVHTGAVKMLARMWRAARSGVHREVTHELR